MKTRIFKFEDIIEFIDESKIQKGYNLYGCLRLDEDFNKNLEEYREERNEAFDDFKNKNENYTLYDVKEFLEDFIDNYEYDLSFYNSGYNRPKKWVVYEDEEAIFSESDLDNFRNLDGTKIDDNSCVCEYITEWDGHNWKTTYLTAEWYDTGIEEITDEYEGIEDRWEQIYGYAGNSDGYKIYYDQETDTLWKYNWSMWQGSSDYYEIVTSDERLEYIINSIYYAYAETPQSLIDELLKDFGHNINKDEKVYIDNDSVCFEYRGEQYHFEEKEIYQEDYDYSRFIKLDMTLEIAREAVEKRRIEAITERFAQQNYKLVDTLPLTKIFVELEDSIKAGNCVKESKALEKEIAESENIQGKYACRADLILEHRDDNYSRRAILNSYRNHCFRNI